MCQRALPGTRVEGEHRLGCTRQLVPLTCPAAAPGLRVRPPDVHQRDRVREAEQRPNSVPWLHVSTARLLSVARAADCAHAHAHTHACARTYIHTCARVQSTHACTQCKHTYMCAHAHKNNYTCTCRHTCVHACMDMHMRSHASTHICVCAQVHARTHAHIHIWPMDNKGPTASVPTQSKILIKPSTPQTLTTNSQLSTGSLIDNINSR